MSRGAEGTTEASGRRDQAGLAARKRRVGAVRGAVPAQNEPKSDRRRAKTPINRRKSRLRRRAAPFANQEQLTGAERELAEHRGLTIAGNHVPWDALLGPAPPTELRADAVSPAPGSGNPVNQAAIIQRVFARSAVARLGVFMPSVAVGQASYPVLSTGQSAAFVAKDGTKEAAAGAITPNALAGVRLQARVQFRIEDVMTTAGLESAYREDLSLTMADQLDAQLIGAGDARVRGFLATAANGGLADYANPGAVVTFATAAEQAARGVDGKYAGAEAECAWVIGTASYQKLAALIQANDSTSATERLRRLLADFMASANIPAAAGDVQSGILAKMGGDMAMNAVCPVWEGLRLIRDEVTNAAEGLINVTAVALHNFAVLRPAGFVRTKLKLGRVEERRVAGRGRWLIRLSQPGRRPSPVGTFPPRIRSPNPARPISGTGLSSGIMRLAHGLPGHDQQTPVSRVPGTRLAPLRRPAGASSGLLTPWRRLTAGSSPSTCACDDIRHSCSSPG